ncbi:MAG: PRC-barrel domain containing protein [Actinobacteria bacterium]|nr:PRC-barrel domain containing protein [Actinomycetota bacterium]
MDDRQETRGRNLATVDIWTFSTDPPLKAADLIGFSVEAVDGGIGKIDEATDDVGRGHLIVDTGPWIFGKKVMLPAGIVDRVDLDAETVFVSRNKDEIKNAPEFDTDALRDDEQYRSRLGGHYGRL